MGAICHDLDHRGYNNKFMIDIKSPLAQVIIMVITRHVNDVCRYLVWRECGSSQNPRNFLSVTIFENAEKHFCQCYDNVLIEGKETPSPNIVLFICETSHTCLTMTMIMTMIIIAQIYTTSTMENHHFTMGVSILQQEANSIFDCLNPEEYKEALDVMKKAILATDLAMFFPNKARLANIVKVQY